MKSESASKEDTDNEFTVLVLQGGGALGAYQAGIYEELAASGHTPDWISGISIGAINAALIAGNSPEKRVERLREFWETVSSHLLAEPLITGERARSVFNQASASFAAIFGLPGFFEPRRPSTFTFQTDTPETLSYYQTEPLRQTLEELVDFDLINTGKTRLSIGAVNIRTGNFAYFDNHQQTIGPEHIMASGALPPGFPPIKIDGEYYWDGGIVSNTPLQYVLDELPRRDMLVFQADLFSATGPMPQTLSDVTEREKDIRFSSRTRLNTDAFRYSQTLRRTAHRLVTKLPDNLKNDPDAITLHEICCDAAITIVHLIHRRKNYFTQSKDFEFSRISIEDHWRCGLADVHQTFHHEDWLTRKKPTAGVAIFDLTRKAEA